MQEATGSINPSFLPAHEKPEGWVWNAYDIQDGTQEVNQDGCKDDDVPGQIGLINPTASFPEDEGQTLIILCCGDEDESRVQHNQDGKLDGHWHHPAGKPRMLGHMASFMTALPHSWNPIIL